MKIHLKKNYDGSFLPADQEAAEWAVKESFEKSRTVGFASDNEIMQIVKQVARDYYAAWKERQ